MLGNTKIERLSSLVPKLAATSSNIERTKLLLNSVQPFGFSTAIVCQLSSDLLNRVDPFFYSNLPDSWFQHFSNSNNAKHNDLLLLARLAEVAFLWSEVKDNPDAFRVSIEGFNCIKAACSHARANGEKWDDGLLVPIRGLAGYCGATIFLGAPSEEFTPKARLLVEAVGQHAHWIMQKTHFGETANQHSKQQNHGLTDRELEVLRYLTKGFTDVESAHKLSIAERTIMHHVTSAKRKLGCNTRAHLACTAKSFGIL